MNSNPSKERKNKKGGWCYTLSKTSARRKAKRIHNKRIRRELDKDHKDPLSECRRMIQ